MKKAFTLAETLIVIAIIGIVAMLVVPNLIMSVPDKNKVYFRKAYASLSQAIQEVASNDFLYPQEYLDRPILSQPNLPTKLIKGKDLLKRQKSLRSVFGIEDNGIMIDHNNFFCYSVKSIMHLNSNTEEDCRCYGASDINNPTFNFETVDGTRFYGLCGAFSDNIDDRLHYNKMIYISVNQAGKPVDNVNIKQEYEAQDRTNKSKVNIFRVKINANGQLKLEDEPEKEFILNSASTK